MSDTENNRENISPNQQTFTYDGKEVPIPIPTYPKPHLQPLGEYVLKPMSEAKPQSLNEYGEFETAYSPRTINSRSNNWKRRQHALALGCTGMWKAFKLLNTKDLQYKKILSDNWSIEVEQLDDFIQGISFTFPDEEEPLYGLDLMRYSRLITSLQSRRNRLMRLGRGNSDSYPSVPHWGDENHPEGVLYLRNDYEILAVTFRCEVESFMCLISMDENNLEATQSKSPPRSILRNSPLRPIPIAEDNEYDQNQQSQQSLPGSSKGKEREIDSRENSHSLSSLPNYTQSQNRSWISSAGSSQGKQQSKGSMFGFKEQEYGPLMRDAFSSPNYRPDGNYSSVDPEVDDEWTSGDEYSPKSSNPFRKDRSRSKPRTSFASNPSINRQHNPYSLQTQTMPSRSTQSKSDWVPTAPNSDYEPLGSSPSGRNTWLSKQAHFDLKLKQEMIPDWDGNEDTLLHWIHKVNSLASRSPVVAEQLGSIIPFKLKGEADNYWCSLPKAIQEQATRSWYNMRNLLSDYFMGPSWQIHQRSICRNMQWRQSGHYDESPSEYFIRKKVLLDHLWNMGDDEIMNEVLNGAPSGWRIVLTPHLLNLQEFQKAIKAHEEILCSYPPVRSLVDQHAISKARYFRDMDGNHPMSSRSSGSNRSSEGNRSTGTKSRSQFQSSLNPTETSSPHAFLGYSENLPSPKHAKDDSNVSLYNTPESKGARGCRHCGSGKHWDKECKYARKEAKANFIAHIPEDTKAEEEYIQAYEDANLDDSDINVDTNQQNQLHFAGSYAVEALPEIKNISKLRGSKTDGSQQSRGYKVGVLTNKRRFKNRRWQVLHKPSYDMRRPVTISGNVDNDSRLVELSPKYIKPPGTTFLGGRAATVPVNLIKRIIHGTEAIIDTGSDISLISADTYNSLGDDKPGIKKGQQISLVQVTGYHKRINDYVTLPIYFETQDGPVKITVEAYVVKNMKAPLIIGNDFGSLFKLSIIREEEMTLLRLGSTMRVIPVVDTCDHPKGHKEGRVFEARSLFSTSDSVDESKSFIPHTIPSVAISEYEASNSRVVTPLPSANKKIATLNTFFTENII